MCTLQRRHTGFKKAKQNPRMRQCRLDENAKEASRVLVLRCLASTSQCAPGLKKIGRLTARLIFVLKNESSHSTGKEVSNPGVVPPRPQQPTMKFVGLANVYP
jgi:hypothetical protein